MGKSVSVIAAIVVSAAALTTATGCALTPPAENRAEPNAARRSSADRLRELERAVEAEIGVPRATELSQCRLIPFGAKPCGGPWKYLVYSTRNTDEAELKRLLDAHRRTQKELNEERRLISDCMFVAEPKASVVDGVCTIESR